MARAAVWIRADSKVCISWAKPLPSTSPRRLPAGTSKPSKVNEEAFNRAVHDIAHATEHLLADLVSTAPPKDRDEEAAKARARSAKRFASA